METIQTKQAIKEFCQGKVKIFYETTYGVASLSNLGNSLYGFCYINKPNHKPTFMCGSAHQSLEKALKEIDGLGRKRNIQITSCSIVFYGK